MDRFSKASKGKKLCTVIAVYLGFFATIFFASAASIFLPAAGMEIGNVEYYSLSPNVSSLVSSVIPPVLGFFAARCFKDKKRIYLVCSVIGIVGIAAMSMANSMWTLVALSAAVGLCTGCVMSLGIMSIGEMFADDGERAMYISLTGTVMAVCMITSGVLTGIVVDSLGWRFVPVLVWPLILLGTILFAVGADPDTDEPVDMGGSVDILSMAGLFLFLGSLIVILSMQSIVPVGSAPFYVFFVLLVVGLVLLVMGIRSRGDAALIPLSLLKSKTFDLMFFSFILNVASSMAFFIFLPYFLQMYAGVSATVAGLVMTVLNIPGVFLGVVIGNMVGKSGSCRSAVLLFGPFRIVAMAVLAFFVTPEMPVWIYFVLSFLNGFTSAVGSSAYTTGAQVQLEPELRAMGIPTLSMANGLGGIIGTAASTLFIGQGIVEGFKPALIVAIVMAALSILLALPLKPLDE